MNKGGLFVDWPSTIWGLDVFAMILTLRLLNLYVEPWLWYQLLPKYQPKRGGDLGWGKLFRFKCGIKNYFQLAKTNLRTQFNCNIDMIENQTQAYISNWISKR